MQAFKKEAKRLLMQASLQLKEYSFTPLSKKGRSGIVVMLHNERNHGGLLDRVKGIVSAYAIAKEKGLPFHIYANPQTFKLQNFLPGKEASLYMPKHTVVYSTWKSKPVYLYNVFHYGRNKLLGLFANGKKQYHVYCNIDYLGKLYPGLDKQAAGDLWRRLFFELFSFDNSFEEAFLQRFTGSARICGIHLRFHSLLGDFKEVISNPLPEEKQEALIHTCINRVETIIQQGGYDAFMVVSDSSIFLSKMNEWSANRNYPCRVVVEGGSIAHIDVDFSEDVLQKTILDFYMLHRCQTIYQVLAPHMYNSQFSRYASVLGNGHYILDKLN